MINGLQFFWASAPWYCLHFLKASWVILNSSFLIHCSLIMDFLACCTWSKFS